MGRKLKALVRMPVKPINEDKRMVDIIMSVRESETIQYYYWSLLINVQLIISTVIIIYKRQVSTHL